MQQVVMQTMDLSENINEAWQKKDSEISNYKNLITEIMQLLDCGKIRIVEKKEGKWIVNEWIKKAILLSFKIYDNKLITGASPNGNWFDKIDSKFENLSHEDYKNSGFRAVPGCYVRHSAFLAKNTIIMPSFINIGAYIDEGTLIDSFATIGSCAQLGKNCHISSGVLIGGVLEPLQANPVIIEDNCFIGGNSQIVEGVIIEEGSVIGMGVSLGKSTKIINRKTGNISYGKIPPYSVVVPGMIHTENNLAISCAIIVKEVDAKTRANTAINELLRD